MRRREFIGGLAGAVAWSAGSLGQQTPGNARIGALILSNPEPYWSLLREGFQQVALEDGRSIELDFRVANGNSSLLVQHASELVKNNVDLIIAIQTPASRAAIQVAKNIPVVIVAGAPVETGLVQSLSRPGSNVTGISTTGTELAAKTLETMRDMLPFLRRVAVLINAMDLTFGKPMSEQVEVAARALGIGVKSLVVNASSPEGMDSAFSDIVSYQAQAVIAQPSLPRDAVLGRAIIYQLPVSTSNTGWTQAGALMSYAADLRDVCRKAVDYAVRILKGSKPGDLAIAQPTRFELVFNVKTARLIGLTIPPSLLARADEVIE